MKSNFFVFDAFGESQLFLVLEICYSAEHVENLMQDCKTPVKTKELLGRISKQEIQVIYEAFAVIDNNKGGFLTIKKE